MKIVEYKLVFAVNNETDNEEMREHILTIIDERLEDSLSSYIMFDAQIVLKNDEMVGGITDISAAAWSEDDFSYDGIDEWQNKAYNAVLEYIQRRE